jgi:hypothetical protein
MLADFALVNLVKSSIIQPLIDMETPAGAIAPAGHVSLN